MSAYQLTLARTGWCVRCGIIRLSVVNTDGICDGCHDDPLPRSAPKKPVGMCSDCNTAPRMPHRAYCRACACARQKKYNRAKKQAAA